MNLLIIFYFLISPIFSQYCTNDKDCKLNAFCDYSTSNQNKYLGICKCKMFYYGENCEKKLNSIQFTKSYGNVMTPFVISFGIGYSFLYIIGFTIIYYCFEHRIGKKKKIRQETEQRSKIYEDKEYQLTQNKAIDIEANNNEIFSKKIDDAIKKDEKEENKLVDNSYRLIGNKGDQEMNTVGMIRTEEVKMIPKTTENHDNKL